MKPIIGLILLMFVGLIGTCIVVPLKIIKYICHQLISLIEFVVNKCIVVILNFAYGINYE